MLLDLVPSASNAFHAGRRPFNVMPNDFFPSPFLASWHWSIFHAKSSKLIWFQRHGLVHPAGRVNMPCQGSKVDIETRWMAQSKV